MRFRFIVVFIVWLLPYISLSQNLLDKRISINVQNITLGKTLNQIGELAGLDFSFNSNLLPVNKLVSINATNKTVREILDDIIYDPTIDYLILDNQIIIKKKRVPRGSKENPVKEKVPDNTKPKETLPKKEVKTETIKKPEEKKVIKKAEPTKEESTKIDSAEIKDKQKDIVVSKEKELPKPDSIIEKEILEESQRKYLELMAKIDSINNLMKNDTVEADEVFDTITIQPVIDTITSLVDSTDTTNIIQSNWYIDLSYAPLTLTENYSPSNNVTNTMSENEINNLSHNFSFKIGYKKNKFLVQTGLSYAIYNKQASYNINMQSTDSIDVDEYIDNSRYSEPFLTDSIYFVLNLVDTTWFVFYDSVWISDIDTISATIRDTTLVKTENNDKIQIQYFQIPLLVSYNFGKNNWSIAPKVGVLASILTTSKGRTLSSDGNSFIEHKDIPYNDLILSLYSSLHLGYKLSNKVELFQETFYTTNLNSIYKPEYGLSNKTNTLGFSLGLRFNLK